MSKRTHAMVYHHQPAHCGHLSLDLALKVHSKVREGLDKFASGSSVIDKKAIDSLPRFDSDEIELGRLLGTGGFSQVFSVDSITPKRNYDKNKDRMVNDRQSRSLPFAVKHIHQKFLSNPRKFRDAAVDLAIEAHLLASFHHDHILSIKGWSSIDSYINGQHNGFFLVLEKLSDTLDKRMSQWANIVKKYHQPESSTKLLFKARLQIARDVADALSYLHERNIVYRDLKPSNIGFDFNGNAKLFDFGLAREMPGKAMDDTYQMSGKCGTARYMAPEVCLAKPYNQKADVYSLALVLWEILALEKPFKNHSRKLHLSAVVEGGERPELDFSWPYGVQAVMHCGWADSIEVRPKMREVYKILFEVVDSLVDYALPAARHHSKATDSASLWKSSSRSVDTTLGSTSDSNNFEQSFGL